MYGYAMASLHCNYRDSHTIMVIGRCHVDGPTAHRSDDPLVRKPIGPKKCHWSEDPLVRKSVSLVRKSLVRKSVIGPKTHWSEKVCHWSENHWSEKVCHWSDGSLVQKRPIGPKITGSKGMFFFSRAVDVTGRTDRET